MVEIPAFEEKPIPWWQRGLAILAFAGVAAFVILGWNRARLDFWEPDNSRVGPNLVASVVTWAIILITASLLWPPTRRRIHRFVSRHTAPLHAHFAEAKAQRERHHKEQMDAHDLHLAHLRHLIHHLPEVPDIHPAADNPAYTPATTDDGKEEAPMAKGQSPAKRATRTAKASATVTKKAAAATPEPTVVKKGTAKKAAPKRGSK